MGTCEMGGTMQQLYQVWDWQKNEAHSYHADWRAAVNEAKRLNSQQAMDWNG